MDLAFLQPLYERPGPWASVYTDTSRQSESTAEERSLVAKDVYRQLTEQGADRRTGQAVSAALEELRHATEPVGRALFATDGAVVLDPPLATAPTATRASWGPLPHTAPLLDLAGEDPLCLIAYVDRRGAAFELRGARGSEGAGEVTGRQSPMSRMAIGDTSEGHYLVAVEDTWEHNAREIAKALAAAHEETRADLVILVGDDRERRAVHDKLPLAMQESTMEAAHGTGSRLLAEEVERLRAVHVHARAADELEGFLAARAPDDEGRPGAVEGVPALVEAAREHRIAELLVRPEGPDVRRPVWIGEEPDQLAVRRTQSKPLGEPAPWPARADDALLRSAAMTGAPALSVTAAGPADTPVGGLGAVLRWKEPPAV
jgi:hypothetical protein